MFGVMGIGSAFINAAGRGGKNIENFWKGITTDADPVVKMSCVGEISVETTYHGEDLIQKYSDLSDTQVSIQADANTYILVKGDVTKLTLTARGWLDFGSEHWTKFEIANTAIEELSVYYNRGLTSLDFSRCPALTKLTCEYTGISNLNIIGNSALESINCSWTYLTSLDVSGLAALKELYASQSSSLTSINLSGCVALETIQVFSTGITSIDVSDCTELTSLRCGATQVASVDVSGLVNLRDLFCNGILSLKSVNAAGCSSLLAVDCHDSYDLEYLNLSGCAALNSLSTSGGPGLQKITTIYYPATNSIVSTEVAGLISGATAADGTVYTDSAGAYYSTIADAATAKGWTIEQLS